MKYLELIDKIFPGYPRQVGMPERRDIYSINELESIIQNWNQKKRIFLSLYNYSFNNINNLKIDKIWFDLDINGYENIIILHSWLVQKKYKHFMVFSGGGFHCYILTQDVELRNSKVAVINSQHYILNETKVQCDPQVIGDVARLVGLPGTYNCKRKRWVIFITEDDLEQGEATIKEKAESDNFGRFKIYGDEPFPISDFDTGIAEYQLLIPIAENLNEKLNTDEDLKYMKPCVANILLNLKTMEHSYNERYTVIIQLIEDGFGESDIEGILKVFLTHEKYEHCIKKERQVRYLFKKNILPPGCNVLKQKGYCPLPNGKLCKYVKR